MPNSNGAVISAVGLTKIFRDFWRRARVKAVNSLDLDIAPGEIFGLLGPNGSGKSTTIKIILGLLHPSRGRVAVFNRPPDDVATKNRIGYLPEESYLYRFLNARETLNYYGTLFRLPRQERLQRTEELLDMVGLRSAARRPVGEYSKGMARRIGLAQALINDPELLILDEPTSGLDPIGAKLVKDIILRLGRQHKKTILLSSHLLSDVEEVCDRVTILYGGRVQVSGTMEEVLAQRDRIQIQCDRLSPETLEAVQALIQEREGKTLEVTTPKDRLESLFLRIVQAAHAQRVETAGSAAAGDIAAFLGEREQGQALLESLVKTEPMADEAERAEAAAPPSRREVDAAMLADLTEAKRPEPEAPPPAAGQAPRPAESLPQRREEDMDRSVLDELAGEDEGKDRS